MKVRMLLVVAILCLAGAAAQNDTGDPDNTTGPEDASGFDLRLAMSGTAVVALVALFVYLARR